MNDGGRIWAGATSAGLSSLLQANISERPEIAPTPARLRIKRFVMLPPEGKKWRRKLLEN
jgi:hypothetical protein